jgi:hypothetical protein
VRGDAPTCALSSSASAFLSRRVSSSCTLINPISTPCHTNARRIVTTNDDGCIMPCMMFDIPTSRAKGKHTCRDSVNRLLPTVNPLSFGSCAWVGDSILTSARSASCSHRARVGHPGLHRVRTLLVRGGIELARRRKSTVSPRQLSSRSAGGGESVSTTLPSPGSL